MADDTNTATGGLRGITSDNTGQHGDRIDAISEPTGGPPGPGLSSDQADTPNANGPASSESALTAEETDDATGQGLVTGNRGGVTGTSDP